MPDITLISGPPGAGKTSVARALATESQANTAVHLHTDDFFNCVVKGYIEPWRAESKAQNMTLTKAIAAAATQLATGGFHVVVDGVIGPWFLPEYLRAFDGHTVNYVVLRPTLHEVTVRARERATAPISSYPPRIYDAFAELGELETHVVDNTQPTLQETTRMVSDGLSTGTFRLHPKPINI